jgi:hypothetical protein
MKSLTRLWSELALDSARQCDTSCDRDVVTCLDRVEHEGDSFLTITLPTFAADFERSLEQGYVDSSLFVSFKKRLSLPAFLQGLTSQVFDIRTGMLREHPSISAIRCVRQLTLIFKKIERETTDSRKQAAENAYIACEMDLEAVEETLSDEQRRAFSTSFAWLYSDVLNDLTRLIERHDVKPKHGPGSTQDKLLGNRKWSFPTWTERLETIFPYARFCTHTWIPGLGYKHHLLPPAQEPPVKVVFVPKTQKTPRVIAMEPAHMQYVQQSIMTSLVPLLEKSPIGLSQGFSDQTINQALARSGSVTGELATLDLSEASDRVLWSLIEGALAPWPTVLEAVSSCRSTSSQLPSGKVISLKKFASMGWALCFPIEVMAFSAIIFTALHKGVGHPARRTLSMFSSGKVRIYGDDIIVPTDSVPCVEEYLETYGLRVNRSKSFSNGKFRESCGGDYYDGTEVTPIRVRHDLPSSKHHVREIVSINATANLLSDGGYDLASEYLHSVCEGLLSLYPDIPRGSDLLGRWSFDPTPTGFSKHLHIPLVRGYAMSSKSPKSTLSEYRALFKALSSDWSDPLHKDHMTHGGRPLAFALKRAWRPTT